MFAACESGVFKVNLDSDGQIYFVRVNSVNMTGCRKVQYDPNTGYIYVVSWGRVFVGKYDRTSPDSELPMSVKFTQASTLDNPGAVNNLIVNGKKVFMATKNGLFVGDHGIGPCSFRMMDGLSALCHGDGIIGTSYGLFDTDGNEVGFQGTSIYSIHQYDGGFLLGTKSGIIDYRSDGTATKVRFTDISAAVDGIMPYGDGNPGQMIMFKTSQGDVYQYSLIDGSLLKVLTRATAAYFGKNTVVIASGMDLVSYSVDGQVTKRTNIVESTERVLGTGFSWL